jgi:RNA polymerase sigma factor (sigma-70 family)
MPLLRHIRHVAFQLDAGELTDGQLLERFLSRREETAFAALVRRHGPMVPGVCRRVLRSDHDAEDAFQATFLVLIRKAASILPRELVGHWLYGVAYRTALKARSMSARRRVVERQVRDMSPSQTLDVVGVLKALKDAGFRNPISIEYESHSANPSPDVKECLVVVEKV